MKTLKYISLLGALFIACSPKNTSLYSEKDGWVIFKKPNYSFETYRTSVELDSLVLSLPIEGTELPILIYADHTNFYIYHKSQSQIIGFDIKSNRESIRLTTPKGYWIQSALIKDSVCFAQTESAFIQFNKIGEILEETKLNESSNLLFSNVNELPLWAYKDAFIVYAYNQNQAFRSPAYYEHEWAHMLSSNTKDLQAIGLQFPEYFKKYLMGLSDVPYLSIKDNLIVYGFSGDPNFYVYNLEEKTQNVYLGSSSHSDGRFPIIPRDSTNNLQELMKVSAHLDLYKTIVYDSLHDIYLRSATVSNGDIKKSKSYLQFFDNSFELIGEAELQEKTGKYLFIQDKLYYTRRFTDSTLTLYTLKPLVEKK